MQHADRRPQQACSSSPAATRPAPQVETKTRHEIEQKKQQLRQVVGDSYRQAWVPRRRLRLRLRLPPLERCLCHPSRLLRRNRTCPRRDLISSADTIIDISRSCHRLVDLAGSLQVRQPSVAVWCRMPCLLPGLAMTVLAQSCGPTVTKYFTSWWQARLGELAGSVAARQAAEGGAAAAAPAASSYDRLHALGSRIKYLIDTPETIYGCLDSGDYLSAVSLQRRSWKHVAACDCMRSGAGKELAKNLACNPFMLPHAVAGAPVRASRRGAPGADGGAGQARGAALPAAAAPVAACQEVQAAGVSPQTRPS